MLSHETWVFEHFGVFPRAFLVTFEKARYCCRFSLNCCSDLSGWIKFKVQSNYLLLPTHNLVDIVKFLLSLKNSVLYSTTSISIYIYTNT